MTLYRPGSVFSNHFAFRTQVKEVSPVQVLRMFDRDFNEHSSDDKISIEDKLFLQKMNDGIHRRSNGHYEMPLPVKGDVNLPNNRAVAVSRLSKQNRRLLSDGQFRKDNVKPD